MAGVKGKWTTRRRGNTAVSDEVVGDQGTHLVPRQQINAPLDALWCREELVDLGRREWVDVTRREPGAE